MVSMAYVLGYLLIGYVLSAVHVHRLAKAKEACGWHTKPCEERHMHGGPGHWPVIALGWPIYAAWLTVVLILRTLAFISEHGSPDRVAEAAAQRRDQWRAAQEEKRRGRVIDVPGVEPITEAEDGLIPQSCLCEGCLDHGKQ